MTATDWKQYDFSDYPYAAETIASAGCGPTACADLLNISPIETAAWLTDHGYAYPYQGTAYEGINACLTAYGADGKMLASGLDYQTSGTVFSQWRKAIQGGVMGVILFHNCVSSYWTNSGHFCAVVSYRDGQYLVYDPASVVRTGWHPWGDFAGNISALYTSNIKWNDSIAEDCFWGIETTRKAQQVFGTTKDGIVSNQNKDMQKFLPNCMEASWKFVPAYKMKNGSDLIRAIQTFLGIEADGFCGMATVVALQKFLGVEPDGYFGGASVLAFQKWLNTK